MEFNKLLVTFTADFDYHDGPLTIAYRRGMTLFVDERCAALAMEAGAAVQDDDDDAFDPSPAAQAPQDIFDALNADADAVEAGDE